jgi:hypothetical protein
MSAVTLPKGALATSFEGKQDAPCLKRTTKSRMAELLAVLLCFLPGVCTGVLNHAKSTVRFLLVAIPGGVGLARQYHRVPRMRKQPRQCQD